MKTWTKPQEFLTRRRQKKTCFIIVTIQKRLIRGMHTGKFSEKVNRRIFQEKRLLLASYISLKIFTMAIVDMRPTSFG